MPLLRCQLPKLIQTVYLLRLSGCGKFKALHVALTCSLWTIDKGCSQTRPSTPPSHGLHVYFVRFILPPGKILPSPSFRKYEICLQSWRFYINLFFNLYWRKSFFLLLLLWSAEKWQPPYSGTYKSATQHFSNYLRFWFFMVEDKPLDSFIRNYCYFKRTPEMFLF